MSLFLVVSAELMRRLDKIVTISEAGFHEIREFLGGNVSALTSREAVQSGAAALLHCDGSGPDIVHAVLPLLIQFVSEGHTGKEVAGAVIAAIERSEGRALLKSANELKNLRRRLTLLLSDDRASVNAKAIALFSERPTLLKSSKVISDLRPIFHPTRGTVDEVEALSVIHTLVLTLQQDGEETHLHIALDAKDLDLLGKVVERAKAKHKALAKVIRRAGVAEVVID